MKLIIVGVLVVVALAGATNLKNLECAGNGHSALDQQLDDAGSKLVVVEFFASWCGAAKQIAPKVEELAKEYSETIVVLLVDVAKCQDLQLEYKILSSPTFLFIKNKETLDRFKGADENKLASLIKQYA